MDIFFCDACGARVGDADLSRGQGLRKGAIVICGSCIEAGSGLDLLASAAPAGGGGTAAKAPPAAAQPGAAAPQGLERSLARAETGRVLRVEAVDHPDRVEDLVEIASEELTPVKPQNFLPPTLQRSAGVTSRRATDPDPTEVGTGSGGLSAIVGGLSALSGQAVRAAEEPPVAVVEEQAARALPPPSKPSGAAGSGSRVGSGTDPLPRQAQVETIDLTVAETGSEALPDTTAGSEQAMNRNSSARSSTRRVADAKAGGRRSGSQRSASSRQGAGGNSRSRSAASAPRPSGRQGGGRPASGREQSSRSNRSAKRGGANKNAMVYGISAVTLLLLIIGGVAIAKSRGTAPAQQQTASAGALSNPGLESKISAAIARSSKAAQGDSISEIESVLSSIHSIVDEASAFCNANGGGTDKRVQSWQDRARLQVLTSSIRSLNDRRSILQSRN